MSLLRVRRLCLKCRCRGPGKQGARTCSGMQHEKQQTVGANLNSHRQIEHFVDALDHFALRKQSSKHDKHWYLSRHIQMVRSSRAHNEAFVRCVGDTPPQIPQIPQIDRAHPIRARSLPYS
jgi:hypothetical protein